MKSGERRIPFALLKLSSALRPGSNLEFDGGVSSLSGTCALRAEKVAVREGNATFSDRTLIINELRACNP